MPRRVIQFIESRGPGGAERLMLNLASGLIKRGHLLMVIPLYESYVSDRCRELGIPYSILKTNRRLDVSLAVRLRKIVSEFRPDLIHAHGLDAGVYASLAAIGSVPVLTTLHGAVELHKGSPWRMWAKGRVLRLARTTLVAVSHDLRHKVIEHGLVNAEKVVTIHNGVDFEFANGCADHESLRAALGIPHSAPVVGTVANARQEKGYERFLKAAAKISRLRPGVRFVIAGNLYVDREAWIRDRIEKMGLEKYVQHLGFRPDIERVFAMLDVFVLASDSEGFSLATVEAMALGKPVVATRCGGPEEIIEDGKTGILVEIDEGAAIAERVLWLHDHPSEARCMGEQAAQSVRERFDIADMLTAYETLYDRLIKSGNTGRL